MERLSRIIWMHSNVITRILIRRRQRKVIVKRGGGSVTTETEIGMMQE